MGGVEEVAALFLSAILKTVMPVDSPKMEKQHATKPRRPPNARPLSVKRKWPRSASSRFVGILNHSSMEGT
jgi:hypothetical protein